MKKKISLIQLDVAFGNPKANLEKVEKLITEAAKDQPDMICLPETWDIGFFPKENFLALVEDEAKSARELLSSLSKKHQVNIVGGSVSNRRGNKVYNTAFVFDRQGNCVAEYDKIHGFSPSGEHTYFEGGTKLCTFELDGIQAGIIICYDIRFVELARSLALKGIQILFIPAHWPHPRLEHWKTLARARAIENQIFVAAINGVGAAGNLKFCGNSMVINPWGDVLVNAEEEEKIVTAEVDFSIVEDIRSRINVFHDRKPQYYQL